MRKIGAIILTSFVFFGACGQKTNEKIESTNSKEVLNSKLKIGDIAPLFKTTGALAGKEYSLNLAEKLQNGPVVLYFFPKVFTPGCTAEAHEFAEKTAEFEKLGATIIGMSGDDIDGLKKFSKEECRDKFAVAMASPEIIKSYNVGLDPLNKMANRTSFVIAQDGTIKFIHSDMDYKNHVKLSYEAVKALKEAK